MAESNSAPVGARGHSPTVARAVALRLHGGQTLEGQAHLPTVQSLASFLGLRRGGLLTVSSPDGVGAGVAPASHVMVRMSSVLFAWSSDGRLAADHRAPGPTRHRIRLTFTDRSEIEGILTFQDGLRVSDYIARVDQFVVLREVVLPDVLGGAVDVAFNIDSVNILMDLGPAALGSTPRTPRPVEPEGGDASAGDGTSRPRGKRRPSQLTFPPPPEP